MTQTYISIGSNLGDPAAQVRAAVDGLRSLGEVKSVSSIYLTEPWGENKAQPYFANAVVSLETALSPVELLRSLKAAERVIGRKPSAERWGPRLIDFDILTYGDQVVNEPFLIIPHQYMFERAFVLVPLAEIDHRYTKHLAALSSAELRSVKKL